MLLRFMPIAIIIFGIPTLASANLDTIPEDVFRHHVVPHLSLKDQSKLSKVNQKLNGSITPNDSRLIADRLTEVQKRYGSGPGALRKAFEAEDIDSAYLLIRKGESISINEKLDEDGLTPLHFAVLSGSLKIVKYLVQKGADLDRRNLDGRSALDLAEYSNLYNTNGYKDKKFHPNPKITDYLRTQDQLIRDSQSRKGVLVDKRMSKNYTSESEPIEMIKEITSWKSMDPKPSNCSESTHHSVEHEVRKIYPERRRADGLQVPPHKIERTIYYSRRSKKGPNFLVRHDQEKVNTSLSNSK